MQSQQAFLKDTVVAVVMRVLGSLYMVYIIMVNYVQRPDEKVSWGQESGTDKWS
jgi:hypothetical protein